MELTPRLGAQHGDCKHRPAAATPAARVQAMLGDALGEFVDRERLADEPGLHRADHGEDARPSERPAKP